ncbi:hypothetical protein AVEN_139774-1 [Araneus ventricosus]|uniref:Tc1-like transposase DDE domain-containing protein n=1 Tax=Araneus ventricosus TaxID=182803 RepID=A0A4Y2T6Z6_ARAVE|nr:hypothetical protein AVEN_228961-1 [Araneus ventricosus]GBN95169.1 hypothetical protein AVEN_139774-1 [Araneus ventricosus]
MRLFREAAGGNFAVMNNNGRSNRVQPVDAFLGKEGIHRMMWPVRSTDRNPKERVWDALRRIFMISPHHANSFVLLQNPSPMRKSDENWNDAIENLDC